MTRRRRFTVVAAIAATVLATLGVVGGAQAAWRASDAVTGSATAGTTAVSTAGFAQLAQQFQSASANTSAPALVKLYNAGTVPLSGFTSTISVPTGAAAFAAAVTLKIWDAGAGATSCTATAPAGASVLSTTWGATTLTWPAPATAIPAPNGNQPYEGYCVVSSMTDTAIAANASQTAAPTVTVTGVRGNWVSAAAAAAAFTLSVASAPASTPTDVTPGQVGIGNSTGGTVSIGVPKTIGDPNQTSNLDPVTGVIIAQWQVCMTVTVSGTSATATPWSFQLDANAAPFNGATISNDTFAPNGAHEAVVTPVAGKAGVYTISGVHQGASTTFNDVANPTWGDASAPDGFSGHVWNTPIKSGQIATLGFCFSPPGVAPVKDPGAGTYSVSAPKIAGCPTGNPATNPDAAMSTPIPASNGHDGQTLCVYVKISGLYPHFYIGYKASFDWAAVVAATPGLTANQRAVLTAEPTAGGWAGYGYGPSAGNPVHWDLAPTNITGTVLSWQEQGLQLPVAIASGQTVVICGSFAIPAP